MGSEGELADTKVGAREISIVDLPKLPSARNFFVDVVADLLMVNQNQGSLHGHGFLLQSAASC